MEFNVYTQFVSEPSAPYEVTLTFYSHQSDDMLFDQEQEIVIYCHSGLRSVGMKWELCRNLFEKSFLTGEAEAQPANVYIIRIPADKLKPGFFDLHVTLDVGNSKKVKGISTFGYQVSKMPVVTNRPADFKEFWSKARDSLKQIPLDAKIELVKVYSKDEIDAYNLSHAAIPADYDPQGHRAEEVEVYKVDFASANGMRVHGWLTKPKGPGPFPTMLVLPGAGFAARPVPLEHARHGYLALDIQVHGQEVDQPTYEKNPAATNPTYESPEKHYFYSVYLNWFQAVNYLCSRQDVDQSRIVVIGGSQGGRGTVVVAAMDSRIAAAIPAIAHYADIPYLYWSRQCNSAKSDGMDRDGPLPLADDAEGKCIPYYDIMNFAPDIHCPVLMNAGFIDPISPVTGVYSTYRLIGSSNKKMVPLPGLGHDWSAEFDRRVAMVG
ncbi:MAG: acetylxylan esterase [Pirellulales bacterium]